MSRTGRREPEKGDTSRADRVWRWWWRPPRCREARASGERGDLTERWDFCGVRYQRWLHQKIEPALALDTLPPFPSPHTRNERRVCPRAEGARRTKCHRDPTTHTRCSTTLYTSMKQQQHHHNTTEHTQTHATSGVCVPERKERDVPVSPRPHHTHQVCRDVGRR